MFPPLLFLHYFAFPEDSRVPNDDRKNHQHFRACFLCLHLWSSIWEMARESPRLPGFSKPLSTHFTEKEGYWEAMAWARMHAHTNTRNAHTQTSRSTYLSPRPPLLGYWSAKWLFHFGLIFQPHPPSKTWKLGSRQQSTISPRCRKLRVSGKKSCSSASPPLHALSPNWVTSRHEVFDNTFFSPSFRDHTEPSLDSHPTNRWLYLLLSWEDGGHQPWSKFNSPLFYL